jgi:hypothetical protein
MVSDPEDEDYAPCEEKEKKKPDTITLTLTQKKWIKKLIPAADRARLSSEHLFRILSDLLTSNGVNLEDVILSPSTIMALRKEAELANDALIKVKVIQ